MFHTVHLKERWYDYTKEFYCIIIRRLRYVRKREGIPCAERERGRVVKGVSSRLIDAGDPVECAKVYDKAGADELVFLDITASSDARETVVDIVEAVAKRIVYTVW